MTHLGCNGEQKDERLDWLGQHGQELIVQTEYVDHLKVLGHTSLMEERGQHIRICLERDPLVLLSAHVGTRCKITMME